MRRVIVESPYAGSTKEEIDANIAYARAAMRDSILQGEAPFASHLLYTQPGILRDQDLGERSLGMKAGMAWGAVADAIVVYTDRGITSGMKAGVTRGEKNGLPIEFRTIPNNVNAAASPQRLHDLLFAIGHDVAPETLARAAQSVLDVSEAVTWAKSEHARVYGIVADPALSCPAWLEEILFPPPITQK